MGPEQLDLTAGTSAEAPSHKFTRANDFTALSALCAIFTRLWPVIARRCWASRDARRDNRRSSRSPISHPASTRGKTAKSERNVSHGETKRFAFSS